MTDHLDALFKPQAVALIGASQKELSIGNVIIKNLLHYGYTGPIYPVNPKVDEIRGLKAYPSILDVPGKVDLVHIVIPPPFVPGEVENCGKKGVKAIIINTAGFKEMGAEGEALENDFLARARKYGIRIFGPNCQGIINSDPSLKAYCNFTFTFPDPGHISIVAQSGGVGAVIHQAFYDMGVGVRMYASNGNASDVSIPEIIRYYGNDDECRVIVLYVESLDNPRQFMEIAREVAMKKPILGLTAGRTDKGAEASRSHIGGLAGNISMELIFRKVGILSFASQHDLCNAAVAFSYQPVPKGKRVGIITNTGGPSVIAIDELVSRGLEIPPLSEKATAALKETMFESASVRNPLDIVATAGATQFRSAFEVLMNEPQFDSIYLNFVTPPFVDCESVAKEIVAAAAKWDKPIVCNYMTDKKKWQETSDILKKGEIPCFDFAETAAGALSSLSAYASLRNGNKGLVRVFSDVDRDAVDNILSDAANDKREVLTAGEVYGILEAYRVPVARWGIASDKDEAIRIAREIGYPLVIKVDAERYIHKSDVDGVAIDIRDDAGVLKVVDRMTDTLGQDVKFFIQQFLPNNLELIVGAKAEKGVGHIIMFGLGGIFVEVLKDVAFTISPVTTLESEELINSIKAAELLKGYRGKPAVNIGAVAEVIQRVSSLVSDFPVISELDINPLFTFNDKVFAVDARIIL